MRRFKMRLFLFLLALSGCVPLVLLLVASEKAVSGQFIYVIWILLAFFGGGFALGVIEGRE